MSEKDEKRYNDTGTHVATVAPNGELWWCPVDYLEHATKEAGYKLVTNEEVGYPFDRTPAALAAEGATRDAALAETPPPTPPALGKRGTTDSGKPAGQNA